MILDIFNDDAFKLASMSAAIDKHKYVPQGIVGSGVFTADPIRTENVGIESRKGKINYYIFHYIYIKLYIFKTWNLFI